MSDSLYTFVTVSYLFIITIIKHSQSLQQFTSVNVRYTPRRFVTFSYLFIYHVQMDTTAQLQNISKLRVYSYEFVDEFAEFANLPPNARSDAGMLAQDVRQVIPDAVQPIGNITLSNGDVVEDFLVVNKV